jgi:hypothetical protein
MAFRYFRRTSEVGTLYGLYRCPKNGRSLRQQALADVEIYRQDGTWLDSQRERLWEAEVSGWFDETSDEISEDQASQLMSQITSGEVVTGFERWIQRYGGS